VSWQSSDTIGEISAALVAALGEMTDVPKSHEAKVQTKAGPGYGYKYANLADSLSMVRPVLAKHGLAVMQVSSTPDQNTVLVTTTLLHKSGEWIMFFPLGMPNGRTAQETGSAITYARRYSLLSCLGLAAEDDDGASAAPRDARQNSPQRPQTVRPAPQAPAARTDAEDAIRRALAGVTTEQAKTIKQGFIAEFGALKDLEPSLHEAALAWVTKRISEQDEADAEWVAAAKTAGADETVHSDEA
jgi:hypothetical protein